MVREMQTCDLCNTVIGPHDGGGRKALVLQFGDLDAAADHLCGACTTKLERAIRKVDELVRPLNKPAPTVAPVAIDQCPDCKVRMVPIKYPGGAMNEDQWASVRAGDWLCEVCSHYWFGDPPKRKGEKRDKGMSGGPATEILPADIVPAAPAPAEPAVPRRQSWADV